jgi:hypothetical protein
MDTGTIRASEPSGGAGPQRGRMSNDEPRRPGVFGGDERGCRAELLALIERMEADARKGSGIDPGLLGRAAQLLPSGPAADALRIEMQRLAAGGSVRTPLAAAADAFAPDRSDLPLAPRAQGSMRALCTITDQNYLSRVLALIESLDRHQPGSYQLHTVCLDEVSRLALGRLGNPCVVPIPLHALEERDERLVSVRAGRSLAEYSWTLKSTMLLWLLAQRAELEVLTYLDADLFFFSPIDRVLDELGNGAALIHRHGFSPEHAHLEKQSGTYNAGMVAVRNDARGLEILRWWRERCLEWCFARAAGGNRSGDQGYLDEWPSRFAGIRVARNPGVGTALWNHRNAPVALGSDGAPCIGGERIAFYHAHGFAMVQPGLVVPATDLGYRPTLSLIRHCYFPYVKAIERGEALARALSPAWNPAPGFKGLTAHHVFIARRDLREVVQRAGIRHPIVEFDARWDCHVAPQILS